MAQVYFCFLFLFSIIRIYSATNINKNEYCVGDSFSPHCQSGEIILMQSAFYGQMRLGRCLPDDLGFLGCQSDVLAQFDQECSGKESCEIFVTEKHINAHGGCRKGLSSYLEAEHICVKGLHIVRECESNQQSVIEANIGEFYLADMQFNDCASRNKGLVLKAKEGQVMNITEINLQYLVSHGDVYGTVKDLMTNKRVVFGDGPREKPLLISSSNEVEITGSENSGLRKRFMLHITVSGCPNLPPPDGAWMTRDGDVMEIGCHSGAKTWSLKCKENQWVGAVGQCGKLPGPQNTDTQVEKPDKPLTNISINSICFGISSLIILFSAIIFLVGVCLLKRKLQSPSYNSLPIQKAVPTVLNDKIADNSTFHTLPNRLPTQQMFPIHSVAMEPGYKSLRMVQGAVAKGVNAPSGQHVENYSPPAYTNTTGSDASDSVKYYVLEDTTPYQ